MRSSISVGINQSDDAIKYERGWTPVDKESSEYIITKHPGISKFDWDPAN